MPVVGRAVTRRLVTGPLPSRLVLRRERRFSRKPSKVKRSALVTVHPPDLELNALQIAASRRRPGCSISNGVMRARQPTGRPAGHLRAPRAFERRHLRRPGGDQQFIHFLTAQQRGAVVIGEAAGASQRSGERRQQAR